MRNSNFLKPALAMIASTLGHTPWITEPTTYSNLKRRMASPASPTSPIPTTGLPPVVCARSSAGACHTGRINDQVFNCEGKGTNVLFDHYLSDPEPASMIEYREHAPSVRAPPSADLRHQRLDHRHQDPAWPDQIGQAEATTLYQNLGRRPSSRPRNAQVIV